MKVRIFFPDTLEKQKGFYEKVAQEQVKIIKNYIEELPINKEEKYSLWEEIKLDIKKDLFKI
ncbi:hypothetical protein [Crassaminicella indica]|uniref:Uncharacterized protein n=1 Tax=Crassaminicella indica TaxID=2855394 RepID=A0ABX8RDK9_9CLOT|nr:hypothetical protein [Crassaminicella indica]QXM05990.1 hypothetical protein KVH43_11610 [Crassaminicella indica]